jgi:dTDP-4-amino-4,6-dideoxygalactose transaminase
LVEYCVLRISYAYALRSIMIPFFDLTQQYKNIQDEIDDATARVLKSGWFILGPEVRAFEKEFAEYIGTQFAIGVGSGTEALHSRCSRSASAPGMR